MTAPADIIAAVATPPGRGGIGVVRISGPDLRPQLQALVGRIPPPRAAMRTAFHDAEGRTIDDGLVLYFPGPHSYTGEDVVELQGHGGPVVMRMLLARCLELGARVAQPGEFTRRAFLNDKLDLAQAESVADVIEAATETAARSAVRSLQGEFSAVVKRLRDQLVELRMLVEATLDFPEEEIDAVDRTDARQRLERLREAVATALASAQRGSLLRAGIQVVLAGQPNVGKSSLLNVLAGHDLAIVTAVPGTTRDAVRQSLEIEGVPVNVVDTAGLRETTDEVERIGMARTWTEIERADLVLLLVDARCGVTAADEAIVARLPTRLPRLVVHNKVDLLGAVPAATGDALFVSAKTGEGMRALQARLLEIAGWRGDEEASFMARERHLAALRRAQAALDAAAGVIGVPELFAEELRTAQASLGEITGEFTADDLLGEIFTRFCIGK